MPLIPVIGRRQPKMRLLIALLYTALSLGAVTMVYPFIVMIGTSVTSPVDHDEFLPVPAYVWDDRWLFRKYVELKYNEDTPRFNALLSNDLATFKDLRRPAGIETAAGRRRVADWLAFRARAAHRRVDAGGDQQHHEYHAGDGDALSRFPARRYGSLSR